MQGLPENAGVNKLKAKRRDVQRVLKKPGLSMEKKTTMERALKVLEEDLAKALERNKAQGVAQKYHMVKFFERQKAVRALRKADAGHSQLADFYYVYYYPKEQKYSALFVEGATGRDSEIYKSVLERMKKGELASGPEGKKSVFEMLKHEAEENKAAQEAQKEAREKRQKIKAKHQKLDAKKALKKQKTQQD